jgi:hypothetical protein
MSADLERIRRLLAGTDPPGPDPLADPEPDPAVVDAMVTRALIERYRRDHPPPLLDRLSPSARRRFRLWP